MLIIAGSEVKKVDTITQVELESEILQKKQLSSVQYQYDSLDALKFELKMRTRIVGTAKRMNKSGVRFASFNTSRCNKKFWSRTEAGGFLLNDGVLPSDGINDIFQNGKLYAFECSTAMVIVLYKAILDETSKEIFNTYFKDLLLIDWNYDSHLRLVEAENKNEDYPGDIRYFDNPDHEPSKPEWKGENVIVLANDLYYGHGIGITTSAGIIAGLNTKRKPGAKKSAFLTDQIVHPDFKYLQSLSNSRNLSNTLNHLIVNPIVVKIGSSTFIC